MKKAIIDLNCRDKEYEFNLSVVKDQDWIDFAYAIVLNKGKEVQQLGLSGFKAIIRDNKAKIKIYYQDTFYHELEYHLDEFGRISKNYQDDISQLWQIILKTHYGDKYSLKLANKLKTLENII